MKKIATRSALSAALTAMTAMTACVVGEEEATETEGASAAASAGGAAELLQEVGTLATSGKYSYSASDTDSAQQNTVNRSISLIAGQKITIGTCGLTGATFTGDTYLRLIGPSVLEAASNDDACGGAGSHFTYVATANSSYQIRSGCYGSSACTGTVVWTLLGTGGDTPGGGSYDYATTNTNSAQQNTIDRSITVAAGQLVSVKICNNITGDPYLRINNPNGTQLAYNDDGCSVHGAQYTWTAATSGAYVIRAGCYSASTCNATVTWTIE